MEEHGQKHILKGLAEYIKSAYKSGTPNDYLKQFSKISQVLKMALDDAKGESDINIKKNTTLKNTIHEMQTRKSEVKEKNKYLQDIARENKLEGKADKGEVSNEGTKGREKK